jgi:hypothetical protein
MNNDLRWMLSSDQQLPYGDKRTIDLWFKVLKWFKPDVVDLLGDTSDQYEYAKFTDGQTGEFLNAIKLEEGDNALPFVFEREKPVAEFYAKHRKMLPNADLFTALGNHDIRIFNYADKKMPELVEKITPQSLWGLDDLGYSYIYYNDLPAHRFGDMYAHHGLSALKHAGESVRSDIDSFGVSLIRGHSHRVGTYNKTFELRNNEQLRGYEIGHMCDEKSFGMRYTQVHNWQKAFAVAHIVNGYPHIQIIQVSPEYECVVDGKTFKG